MSRHRSNATEPMRRCIGCMESKAKSGMYKIALKNGELTLDKDGKAIGRGVYICKDKDCIEKAKKKNGLQRGFRRNFQVEMTDDIFEKISEECNDAQQ